MEDIDKTYAYIKSILKVDELTFNIKRIVKYSYYDGYNQGRLDAIEELKLMIKN